MFKMRDKRTKKMDKRTKKMDRFYELVYEYPKKAVPIREIAKKTGLSKSTVLTIIRK